MTQERKESTKARLATNNVTRNPVMIRQSGVKVGARCGVRPSRSAEAAIERARGEIAPIILISLFERALPKPQELAHCGSAIGHPGQRPGHPRSHHRLDQPQGRASAEVSLASPELLNHVLKLLRREPIV